MSSLAAARADNFYYPKDFDPNKHKSLNKYHGSHALRERAAKIGQGILVIRFEVPFHIICDKCHEMVAKGERFNADKKSIGQYHSTKIWEFRMRHHCGCCFVIVTDPKNSKYLVVEGAKQKAEEYTAADAEVIELTDEKEREQLRADPLYRLEHGENIKIKALSGAEAIAEIQDRNEAAHYDNYGVNKLLRTRLRRAKAEDAGLKAKRDAIGLPGSVPLLPEDDTDAVAASIAFLSDETRSKGAHSKMKKAILGQSIFTSSSSSRPSRWPREMSAHDVVRRASHIEKAVDRSVNTVGTSSAHFCLQSAEGSHASQGAASSVYAIHAVLQARNDDIEKDQPSSSLSSPQPAAHTAATLAVPLMGRVSTVGAISEDKLKCRPGCEKGSWREPGGAPSTSSNEVPRDVKSATAGRTLPGAAALEASEALNRKMKLMKKAAASNLVTQARGTYLAPESHGRTEFSAACIPIQEVSSFYDISSAVIPQDRPYIWSMTVATLDGRIGFSEPNVLPPAIALAGLRDGHSEADWRLLNAGWAYADAVMISGECLRTEPSTKCKPCYDDLLELRREVRGHSVRHYPTNIVLTTSGDVDPTHPIFGDLELGPVLIATTRSGQEKLVSRLKQCGASAGFIISEPQVVSETAEVTVVSSKRVNIDVDSNGASKAADYMNSNNGVGKSPVESAFVLVTRIRIIVIHDPEDVNHSQSGVSYSLLLRHLRVVESIRYLDVSAGGVVIGGMMRQKLIDEVRLTIAGQVIGPYAPDGSARPSLVTLNPSQSFSQDDSALIDFVGIRAWGPKHIFLRGAVSYRHSFAGGSY
ncbi:hypothetical protein CEUSTIGMA_g10355.t1 [Chlamydomonas eustigma]|uniref:Uncharacterized protein n=1 Tax=Chlamydomonas eustigma TaxID=1157962 RepID=A0A250XIL9_9CHLO|nr:hypothetical protein CEUSTIGMA_g10355.t1 [Chlamydomonas eustigma]|eukprot:GAX82928.1 hypothetical protein CEUSTIGMA_g10355.t1 [Chlamydomonas eustigma]